MSRTFLYTGCYTPESPTGIRVYESADPDGLLVERGEVGGVEHPSFLAAHPNGRTLYAVSETSTFENGEGGGVVAFRIEPTDGSLTPIDRVSSHGAGPCYVSLGTGGRHVYVANYVSGSIAVYAVAPDGRFGKLIASHQHHGSGPSPRQEGPHAHCVIPGSSGLSVYAVDLGTDRVVRYEHGGRQPDSEFGAREELALEPGSGPRHLTFHPTDPVAFLVCELHSTIVVLALDPRTGGLTEVSSCSTLPDEFVGDSTAAEVRVHPRGHRIYVSNRGDDSLAVFGFSGREKHLEPLGHVKSGGRTPRNFEVHPSGRSLLVANQDSNNIVEFKIDPHTGIPQQLDATYEVPEPVCLTFVEVAS
jgi:6-phosphogluconolactonase